MKNSFSIHRENKIPGIIEATFSVENNSFGALVVHELKPNGAQIAVTEENKREYVKLYVNYRFMRGIEQQFLWLQKGNSTRYILLVPEMKLFLISLIIRLLRIDSHPIFATI